MVLDFSKSYTAYENKFEEQDVVVLKKGDVLSSIQIMLNDAIPDPKYISWFLDEEKEAQLEGKSLVIESCIFWHMGIPFYKVNYGDKSYFIAEFYIELLI